MSDNKSFLSFINPAAAAKGVGGLINGAIATAKLAGKAQAMIHAATDDTDNDKVPQYKEALNIVVDMVNRLHAPNGTAVVWSKTLSQFNTIKSEWLEEKDFYSSKGKELFTLLKDLFVHVMVAEKETHVALLSPPKEESQSA